MRNRILKLKFRELREFCYVRNCVAEYIHDALGDLSEHHSVLMEVAVNEAVNNALKHGNCGRTAKLITLKLFVLNNTQLIVSVNDGGAGFPGNQRLAELPLKQCFINKDAPKDSGRGLMIMESATDGLSYNPQGNEVTLIKNLRH
ncbi:MAG: ATP-binding protein [Desulfitobacteriaceae bacterium]